MPAYPGDGQAKLLNYNTQGFLFAQESLPSANLPVASIAFELSRTTSTYYPWGVSFEIWFSGNPGSFEIDIQSADIDAATHYCTINSINSTAALNSNFVGRIEIPQFWARYVRAVVKSLANAVTVSVLVTR